MDSRKIAVKLEGSSRVRFREDVDVIEIEYQNSVSKTWLSWRDLRSIKEDAREELKEIQEFQAEMKHHADLSSLWDDVICERGLDFVDQDAISKRRRHRRCCLNAVLGEQSFQRKHGGLSDGTEKIATICKTASAPYVRAARKIAEKDRFDIEVYVRETSSRRSKFSSWRSSSWPKARPSIVASIHKRFSKSKKKPSIFRMKATRTAPLAAPPAN